MKSQRFRKDSYCSHRNRRLVAIGRGEISVQEVEVASCRPRHTPQCFGKTSSWPAARAPCFARPFAERMPIFTPESWTEYGGLTGLTYTSCRYFQKARFVRSFPIVNKLE